MFLLIFCTQATKLQSFLKLLPCQDLDRNRTELVWKAQIALVLLYAERNQDTSVVSNSLLDMVEQSASHKESANMMRIFSEGFQDLVDSTNNLELGQYIFIGWYLFGCFSLSMVLGVNSKGVRETLLLL